MAEQKKRESDADPAGGTPAGGGETFKREGPWPATNDTGRDVDEMNEKARDSVISNVTPEEATD